MRGAAFYLGLDPWKDPAPSLEFIRLPQPSGQSKAHSSVLNELHKIVTSQIIDFQLTATQSLSRAQYLWKSVWRLQHPFYPPGILSAVLELGHIIREWKDHADLALKELLLLNFTLASSPLSYPMGLKKKPMKSSIVLDLMIGLGALSAMPSLPGRAV